MLKLIQRSFRVDKYSYLILGYQHGGSRSSVCMATLQSHISLLKCSFSFINNPIGYYQFVHRSTICRLCSRYVTNNYIWTGIAQSV